MKRMMLILIIAVILFGVSAGLSVFMQDNAHKEPDGHAEKGEKGTKGLRPGKGEADSPDDLKGAALPSRALAKPSAESLAQLAASLRQKEELLQAKDQKLTTRQKQMDLIFADMKSEQKGLDALRQEIAAEMKLLQDKMDELERKGGDLDKKKTKLSEHATEVKKALFEVDAVEQTRIKQMAVMYNAMEPETASEVFQQMADGGKLELAVKILANMQERQAARVLSQNQDRATVVLMLEKLKGLKKAEAP